MRWKNVPVPEPHLGGLAIGLVLQFFVAARLFPEGWIAHALGWPLVLAGASIAAWAVAAAGEQDVERPDVLVVTGPYAHSRNPMYVGWFLLYVGITFAINTVWPLVLLPVVALFTHVTILKEERALEDRFGEEYRSYRAAVRRYA